MSAGLKNTHPYLVELLFTRKNVNEYQKNQQCVLAARKDSFGQEVSELDYTVLACFKVSLGE